jgi:hypothetical protein
MSTVFIFLWMAFSSVVLLILMPGLLSVLLGIFVMVLSGWGASLIYRSRLGRDEPYQIMRKVLITVLTLICLAQPYAIFCRVNLQNWRLWAKSLENEIHTGMTESNVLQLLETHAKITTRAKKENNRQEINITPKWPIFSAGEERRLSLQYGQDGRLEKATITTLD